MKGLTIEEKQLLLKDLCTRLPYHVRVKVWLKDKTTEEGFFDFEHNYGDVLKDFFFYNELKDLKPYLRPMSSMTEEETEEYRSLSDEVICTYGPYNTECKFHCVRLGIKPDNPHECIDDYLNMDAIDWLNAHHFDYRGLIEKGLALEAPKDMYKL